MVLLLTVVEVVAMLLLWRGVGRCHAAQLGVTRRAQSAGHRQLCVHPTAETGLAADALHASVLGLQAGKAAFARLQAVVAAAGLVVHGAETAPLAQVSHPKHVRSEGVVK